MDFKSETTKNVAIVAVVILGISAWNAYNKSTKETDTVTYKQAASENFAKGPRVIQERAISGTESVRTIVVPHPLGKAFDTTCIIYTNSEYKTSAMQCPDMDRMPAE